MDEHVLPAGAGAAPGAPGSLTPIPPETPPSGTRGLGVDYWKLWAASVVSNLGDGTSVVAYPWLASVLTRDPLLVAGLTVGMRLDGSSSASPPVL